jgi:hypothetical protein
LIGGAAWEGRNSETSAQFGILVGLGADFSEFLPEGVEEKHAREFFLRRCGLKKEKSAGRGVIKKDKNTGREGMIKPQQEKQRQKNNLCRRRRACRGESWVRLGLKFVPQLLCLLVCVRVCV